MKQSDSRYSTINVLIKSGHIKSYSDIFRVIPKTIVYKDLGVNFNRFSKSILDPSRLSMKEIMTLADMFEVDQKMLINMAYEQALTTKTRSHKKIK